MALDPVTAIATAAGKLADAAPAFAVAVRPDPVVSAARAYGMGRRTRRKDAAIIGRLTLRRDVLLAHVAAIEAELAALAADG